MIHTPLEGKWQNEPNMHRRSISSRRAAALAAAAKPIAQSTPKITRLNMMVPHTGSVEKCYRPHKWHIDALH